MNHVAISDREEPPGSIHEVNGILLRVKAVMSIEQVSREVLPGIIEKAVKAYGAPVFHRCEQVPEP